LSEHLKVFLDFGSIRRVVRIIVSPNLEALVAGTFASAVEVEITIDAKVLLTLAATDGSFFRFTLLAESFQRSGFWRRILKALFKCCHAP